MAASCDHGEVTGHLGGPEPEPLEESEPGAYAVLVAADEADPDGYAVLAEEDPTHTKTLREKYAQRLRGAYDEIIKAVWTAVRDRDVLGLEGEALTTPPRNFEGNSSDEKAERFATWLYDNLEGETLDIIDENQNQYIQQGVKRGISDGESELYQAGHDISTTDEADMFNLPVHRDKAELLYTRNYQELKGINDAVGDEVGRVLTEGIIEGKGPEDMARSINDRIDNVGRTRATTLAHTEVIHAHAEGKLDTFEREGMDEVVGQAEVSTANDSRVCEQCAGYHGNRYDLDDVRGFIPVHPRCRCTWKPVTAASEERGDFTAYEL